MTRSIFEPIPAGLNEPPALRRAKMEARPGGKLALAARAAILNQWNEMSVQRFAGSEIGRSSAHLLDELHDSQSGATGVVVCNGPSVNHSNLDLIAGHPFILMNRGYLLAERLPGTPAALCVSADLVLEQYGNEIAGMNTPLLLSVEQKELITRRQQVAFVHRHRKWEFASRIGSSLHMGYTVTFWALQMAFHLGWAKCLIIGMDHRYDQTGDPTVAVRTEGRDQNHFDPNYFEHGAKWLLPALEMNDYSYQLVRAAYESHGRQVVDCTVGGACKIFDRSTLEVELLR